MRNAAITAVRQHLGRRVAIGALSLAAVGSAVGFSAVGFSAAAASAATVSHRPALPASLRMGNERPDRGGELSSADTASGSARGEVSRGEHASAHLTLGDGASIDHRQGADA